MKNIAALAAALAAASLSACCFFVSGSPKAAAPAPAPAAARAPAPAPVPKAPERTTITLAVEFDTAQAVVKPEYDDQLKKVADFLKANPDSKAEIEGHTDNVGQAEQNKALSQRRAEAVRQALIDRFGIDGGRLTAVGYGSERPLAGNDTAADRASNRRVVATFIGAQ